MVVVVIAEPLGAVVVVAAAEVVVDEATAARAALGVSELQATETTNATRAKTRRSRSTPSQLPRRSGP